MNNVLENGYFEFEESKAKKSLEYAQAVRGREAINNSLTMSFEESSRFTELQATATLLGFVETATMDSLKKTLKEVQDFESAKAVCIQYRIEGEAEVDKQELSKVGRALAQIGLEMGLATLYLENNHLPELEEFFYDEIEEAEMAITHLMDFLNAEA